MDIKQTIEDPSSLIRLAYLSGFIIVSAVIVYLFEFNLLNLELLNNKGGD